MKIAALFAALFATAIFVSQFVCLFAYAAPVKPSVKSTAPHTKQSALRPGWTMEQISQLCGEMSVTLSLKGIRVLSRKHSLSMICVAPFKDVIIYSELTKKYFSESLSTFRCPGNKTLALVNGGLLRDVPVIRKEDRKYRDRQVHTYISTPGFSQSQQLRFNQHEIPGRAVKKVDIFATEDFKTDAKVSESLGRFYGLPKISGFPIYVHYDDFSYDGFSVDNLKTTKMTPTQVADSIFDLPPNMSKAKTQQDVFIGNSTNDAILIMTDH